MKLSSLVLTLSDADLSSILSQLTPYLTSSGIKDPTASFTSSGLVLAGRYRFSLLSVPFSTTWTLTAMNTEIVATLTDVKAANVPLTLSVLRGQIMRAIADAITGIAGLRVHGDCLIVRVGDVMKSLGGVELEVTWKSVTVKDGSAEFVAK